MMANARQIHNSEGGNWQVIELAVLLHDVADPKFFDEKIMLQQIEQKLTDAGVEIEIKKEVA